MESQSLILMCVEKNLLNLLLQRKGLTHSIVECTAVLDIQKCRELSLLNNGISSPPIVYYISSGQEEIRLNEYSCRKLTHEMHSFVTAASKRINVCNMNLEYNDIFYTNDF